MNWDDTGFLLSKNKYNVIGTINRDISTYEVIRKTRIAEASNSKVKIKWISSDKITTKNALVCPKVDTVAKSRTPIAE